MGASYCGYTSDITCSFPVSGKFTKDQAVIYNAVLKANTAVMNAAKPGNMHSFLIMTVNLVNRNDVSHQRKTWREGKREEKHSFLKSVLFWPHDNILDFNNVGSCY
jgi:hypothetical protein